MRISPASPDGARRGVPGSTKTCESQKQERPRPQDDGPSPDPSARESSTDLTEPGKHVESCSNTGLSAGSRNSYLVEDDRI